jgi:hypothetical protein
MFIILAYVLSTDYVLTPVPAVEQNINTWGVTVPASVPPSAGFSLRRFFSGRGRLVVRDGGRLHSPDEEDAGVEWCCCRGDFLSVLF